MASLQQPRRCAEACDSQQEERLGCTLISDAASPSGPKPLGSPGDRAAQTDAHQPANSGDDGTAHEASTEAHAMAAKAEGSFQTHFAGADGKERGDRPETGSTESRAEAAWGDEPSGHQRAKWEARTGPSSRSGSVPLKQPRLPGTVCEDAAAWQKADEEVAGTYGQVVLDAEAACLTSSCNSVQHGTLPVKEEELVNNVQPPSGGAAALPHSASSQPVNLSPAQGQQQAELSCTNSAGDAEPRPSEFSMPLPHEQASQVSEHRQSRTGVAGCSSGEPSPSARAEHPQPPILSPHSHHELEASGGALATAPQEADLSDSASQAADQEYTAGDGKAQQDAVDPAIPARSEADAAQHGHAWRSSALSQVHGAYDKATDIKATETHSVSPEEDELSRRMRSFLARLSGGPESAGDCGSAGHGSAFSLQAAQGSEGTSDRGDDVGTEQVTWVTLPTSRDNIPCCLSPISFQGLCRCIQHLCVRHALQSLKSIRSSIDMIDCLGEELQSRRLMVMGRVEETPKDTL